jgi:protein phosphatase
LKVFSKSEIGSQRETNQDNCSFKVTENFVCAVVCDGVGGCKGGGVASGLVVQVVKKEAENINSTDEDYLKGFLFDTAKKANEAIYEKAKSSDELKNMGTTMVLSVICDGIIRLVYAGDSRAYLLSKSEPSIRQITTDHSIVQDMINQGHITPDEAKVHPLRNVITRSLGTNLGVEFDYVKEEFPDESALLICTDGLTNSLSDGEILNTFMESQSAEEFVTSTMTLAKERGGQDDVTILAASKD